MRKCYSKNLKINRSEKERAVKPFLFLSFFTSVFFLSVLPKTLFAQIGFSYSYFDLTRNNGGGTLEPGDIIEVHALGFVTTGTTIKNFYFTDSIRSGTQYVPGSMRIITNEGVTLLAFTDASNDDAGVYDASPTPRIRINIGTSIPGGVAKVEGDIQIAAAVVLSMVAMYPKQGQVP